MAVQTPTIGTRTPAIEAKRLFDMPARPQPSVAEVSVLVADAETWSRHPASHKPEWSASEVDGVVVAVRMFA